MKIEKIKAYTRMGIFFIFPIIFICCIYFCGSSNTIEANELDTKVKRIPMEIIEEQLKPFCQMNPHKGGEPKVLLIGIDGASLETIQKLVEKGKLPTFERLIKEGAFGHLKSIVIPSSAPAWTTAITGFLPSSHQVFSFFTQISNSDQFAITNSTARKTKAIWEILELFEKRSVVINVPMTFPPDEINGVMISGIPGREDLNFTYPVQMSKILNKMGYLIDYKKLKNIKGISPDALENGSEELGVEDLFNISLNQAKIAQFLFKSCQWDFFMVVFTITDRIQHSIHLLPEFVLENAYYQMDVFIRFFLESLPSNCTLGLVSDHGFKGYNKGFFIVNWLKEKGYCSVKNGKTFWEEAVVYPIEAVGNYFVIRINKNNLERDKIIDENRIKVFKNKLKKELLEIKDWEKKIPVVKSVFEGKELYDGNYLFDDLIVELDPDYLALYIDNANLGIIANLNVPIHSHNMEGIIFLYNPLIINANMELEANIEDITPTVLYLLGIPVHQDFNGKVVIEAFKKDHLKRNPIKRSNYSIIREVKILKMPPDKENLKLLRSLGYIQ